MEFIDIVFAVLLGYSIYNGLKNGLFVEIASFSSLVVGIFVAIKLSHIVRLALEEKIKTNPKYIEIIAFATTFILVLIAIHLLAKFFTSIASFAYLGWLNKLGGAVFSMLKTILMLGVLLNLLQKINSNSVLVKEETLNKSLFYKPVQEVSKFMSPNLEKWYDEVKERTKETPENEKVSDSLNVDKKE
ncbi:CvpA family protein [Flavobacterium sp.]|jgi:membrane protein required for colicin V production|uniref:CvpA family protein n=1 Tax=Flavobacterium sp. TaxID=239 RepID=UPI0037BFD47D